MLQLTLNFLFAFLVASAKAAIPAVSNAMPPTTAIMTFIPGMEAVNAVVNGLQLLRWLHKHQGPQQLFELLLRMQ